MRVRYLKTDGSEHTNGIVLEHAQRSVLTGAHKGLVIAGHGHGDEAHRDGAGLCCFGEKCQSQFRK